MQIEINIPKEKVIIYDAYDGHIVKELKAGIYQVEYKHNGATRQSAIHQKYIRWIDEETR